MPTNAELAAELDQARAELDQTRAELDTTRAELEEARTRTAPEEAPTAVPVPSFQSEGLVNDVRQAYADTQADGKERVVRDPNTSATYRFRFADGKVQGSAVDKDGNDLGEVVLY